MINQIRFMKLINTRSVTAGIIVLLALCSPSVGWSQVVTGRVVDAQTDVPLPAATIHVAGTFRGTITNTEGHFEINPDVYPADLVVRFLGFRSDTVRVAEAGSITVRLEPASIELETLTVTAEDPGMRIMREVIRRKQDWRADLDTYKAQAYTRIVFANEEGIVAIGESASTAWWKRDQGFREVQSGSRSTDNMDEINLMPAAILMNNLYDDDIFVYGYMLRGVTHPNALRHYDFKLIQTRRIDGVAYHDIEAAPRSVLGSGFVGRITVHGDEYAMVDVELRPGKAFMFPPPIKSLNVTLRQQFFNFGTAAWLPVDMQSENSLEVSIGPLLSFPKINVDLVGRFTDYQINVPVPDSLFARDDLVVLDSAAVESGAVFEEDGVVVPYTPLETLAYESIDSTMTLEKAYEPQGALARALRAQNEIERASERTFSLVLFPGIQKTPRLHYNRVDGLHAGLGLGYTIKQVVKLSGGGGWSSGLDGSERWAYDASIGWDLELANNIDLNLEGGYSARTKPTYTAEHRTQFTNSFSVFMYGRDDHFDYYRAAGQFVSAKLRTGRRRHSVNLTWRSETHAQLPLTTSYDLSGNKEPQRPNGLIPEGLMRSITASWATGQPPMTIVGTVSGANEIRFQVERTIPGSDFSFTRYAASAYWRWDTMLSRRLLPATLDVRAIVGASTGELPPQRIHIVERGNGNFRPFGTLRAYGGLPYTGKQVAAVFWEHNFRSIPFELVGLRGLARRGYNMLIFGGHAWIKNDAWLPRHEVGASLSGILGLFRFDVAKPLSEPGIQWGWGVARLI